MKLLECLVFVVCAHVMMNLFIIYREDWVMKIAHKLHPKVATLIFGPEIGWKLNHSDVSLLKTVALSLGAFGAVGASPHLLLFPVFNLIRDKAGKSMTGIRWSIEEGVKAYKNGLHWSRKVLGHMIAPGLMTPGVLGAKVCHTLSEFDWDELFSPIQESLSEWYEHFKAVEYNEEDFDVYYKYRGAHLIVFPCLNAFFLPTGIFVEDLFKLLYKAADCFGINRCKLPPIEQWKTLPFETIVVDPIIYYCFKRKHKWAQAIMDHEIGHRDSLTNTPLKYTLYLRMFSNPKKALFWKLTLLQEGVASILALLEDEKVDKTKAAVLSVAFASYIKAAKEAMK